MKIFVAGATGVLGRRVIPLLIAEGHDVTAVGRTPEKAAALRAAGATPVTVDLFDAAAVAAALAGHDVVANLATHVPPLTHAARRSAWEEHARIRTDASRNLVDGAIAAGATRYIQESIAFLYDDAGDRWVDESAPLTPSPYTESTLAAEANTARFTAAGGVGVALRFGLFYGAGASHTVDQLRLARQGVSPGVGNPDGYQSMIHLDDAATAVIAALRAPAGVYNVVEDNPLTRGEQTRAIAAAIGSGPLWSPPPVATKAVGAGVNTVARSLRVRNSAFRTATGWAPAYPDPWSGWRQIVAASPAPSGERGSRMLVRASLAILGFQTATLGFWATFAPKNFYDNFPGGGRHWVSIDGPYNHHLVTDVGALSLALLVITVAAGLGHSRAMIRTAGAAWLVFSLPHFLYHLGHRHGLATGDQIASLGGLGLEVLLAALIVVFAPARYREPLAPAASSSSSEAWVRATALSG